MTVDPVAALAGPISPAWTQDPFRRGRPLIGLRSTARSGPFSLRLVTYPSLQIKGHDGLAFGVLIDDDLPVAVPVGEESWTARALALGADGRVDIVGIETAEDLTVATHRKLGWRYWPSGELMTMDIDLADTARQAVGHVLPDEPSSALHDEMQSAGRRHLDETARLGALVLDGKTWPTRPISVDGTNFGLFVITTAHGQAAVADLGPVRLALYGPSIPHNLALQLTPLRTLTLAPVIYGDTDE